MEGGVGEMLMVMAVATIVAGVAFVAFLIACAILAFMSSPRPRALIWLTVALLVTAIAAIPLGFFGWAAYYELSR